MSRTSSGSGPAVKEPCVAIRLSRPAANASPAPIVLTTSTGVAATDTGGAVAVYAVLPLAPRVRITSRPPAARFRQVSSGPAPGHRRSRSSSLAFTTCASLPQLAQRRRAVVRTQGAVPADVGVHEEQGALGRGGGGRPHGGCRGLHDGREPAHVHRAEFTGPRGQVGQLERRGVLEVEVVVRAPFARLGDRQRGGQAGARAQRGGDPGGPQPLLDGAGEAVATEAPGEGHRGAERGEAHGDVGRGPAELGGPYAAVPGHRHEVDEGLTEHEDGARTVRHGSTTILRPMPALKRSMACAYWSSGSRSLMKTAGSSTPAAKRAAARS